MWFYRLRQWLGILLTFSMLLQTSAPMLALSITWESDNPDSSELMDPDRGYTAEIIGDKTPYAEQVEEEPDKVDVDEDDYSVAPTAPNEREAISKLSQPQQLTGGSSLMFIENVGQYDAAVRFKLQGGEHTMFFTEDAVWLTAAEPVTDDLEDCSNETQARNQREAPDSCGPTAWRGNHIKMSFVGANPNFRVVGIDPVDTTVSFFYGNDPDQWRPNVPVYSGIRLENVYPDIDIMYTIVNGQLLPQAESKSLQADLSLVALEIEGAEVTNANSFGHMSLKTSIGAIQIPLFSYISKYGPPASKPQTNGKIIAGPFATVPAQATNPDDQLIYSTYVRGEGNGDFIFDLAIDSNGNAFVAGATWSTVFPTTPGAFQETYDGNGLIQNNFVFKLNQDGSEVLYATFLGLHVDTGNRGTAITVDETGCAYIAGTTMSEGFPVTDGVVQENYGGGGSDGFVAKLNTTGSDLIFSTFIGGGNSEAPDSIVVDGNGASYITGVTYSSNYPTTSGVIQPSFGGISDAFVTKLNATGSQIVFSTFLGGEDAENTDGSGGIVLDRTSEIYVSGYTRSDFFPTTTGSYQPIIGDNIPHSPGDAFISKLSQDGSQLIYSTYLGGNDYENVSGGRSIAVDNDGFLYIVGSTSSTSFPITSNVIQPNISLNGDHDFFITKLNPTGSDLVFSTYLGGSGAEPHDLSNAGSIAIDRGKNVYIYGQTDSTDFPTTEGAFQELPLGGDDTIVSKLRFDATELLYSTYLGGSGRDGWNSGGIALDSTGVYVAGSTLSDDFPVTPNAYQVSADYWYNSDGFVTKLDLSSPSLFLGQDWNVECPFCNVADTQGIEYGINTRTGNFGHMDTALSLPTAGGSLDFRYGYISQATDMYTTTMGFGWVHNHELQLHISDPALTHTVILQAPGGSRFPYTGNGDGTYEKYPGVTADMVYNSSADEFVVTTFNQYEFTFNGDGQLQEQKDPFGNLTTFSYSNGKLSQASQGSRSLTYFYNGDRLNSVQDDTGRTVTLGYTGDDLTSVTTPAGVITYKYEGSPHLLTEVVDASGRTIKEITYDGSDRAYQLRNGNGDLLVDITYPSGTAAPQATTINYADLSITVQVEVNGIAMTHVYDSRGVLTDVTYDCVDGTAGCGAGSDTGYDYNFKQTAMQDTNGNATQLRWDQGGSNIEFVADALGNATALTYDNYNNLTQTVDARGITTTLYYENPAFPTFRTRTVNALGHTRLYTPTVAGVDGAVGGLLKAEQDAAGLVTTYQYNDQGQISETVRAAGTNAAVTTSYGYDSLGRMITTTQAAAGESRTTLNVYNDSDDLLATISNWTGSDPAAWAAYCDTSPGERDTNVCTRYGYDGAGRTILGISHFRA